MEGGSRSGRQPGGRGIAGLVLRTRLQMRRDRRRERAMLEDAGFVARMLEVRTFVSVFRDVAQIIDFLQATTYGQLAADARAGYYAGFRDAMEALVAGEYADRVSSDGIRLERYILLAIADKR